MGDRGDLSAVSEFSETKGHILRIYILRPIFCGLPDFSGAG
jgi:hypothetical protein